MAEEVHDVARRPLSARKLRDLGRGLAGEQKQRQRREEDEGICPHPRRDRHRKRG